MDRMERFGKHLLAFVKARDWQQFHSPKNLVMALTVEAAEVQKIFQWLTEDQSRSLTSEDREATENELADVFIYVLRVSQVLAIDIIRVAERKLKQHEAKYPMETANGTTKEYTAV
jgi:dCTP diphosphatase